MLCKGSAGPAPNSSRQLGPNAENRIREVNQRARVPLDPSEGGFDDSRLLHGVKLRIRFITVAFRPSIGDFRSNRCIHVHIELPSND
jgi:hypothetical protein